MTMKQWNTLAASRRQRIERGLSVTGRLADPLKMTALLEAVIEPGDRVCIEGNNQKQADFLARSLVRANPAVLHDLHMLQSVLALPEHLDVFERGIARKLDFSFSGPQAVRLARMMQAACGSLQCRLVLTMYCLSLIQTIVQKSSCR